jgi:hypothetical protein
MRRIPPLRQKPSVPEASAQKINRTDMPPSVTPKQNLPQAPPKGSGDEIGKDQTPVIPEPGPKNLPDDVLKKKIKENYMAGLDWAENALVMRRAGVVPKPGSEWDKLFRKLYDLDYE